MALFGKEKRRRSLVELRCAEVLYRNEKRGEGSV